MASGVSVKVEQLDYETREHIDEYPSIGAAAEDNWMTHSTLSVALIRGNGTAVFKRKKMVFRKIEL